MATPYRPTREERIEDVKRWVLPGLAALIVLGVGAWVAWHQLARPAALPGTGAAAANPAVARLGAVVDELEKKYRSLELTTAEPAERDAALTALIAQQREVVQLGPAAGPGQTARLQRFERLRAELRSQVAGARSLALEAEAREQLGAGRRAGAIDLLREALRFQHEANGNAPAGTLRNLAREAELTARITDLAAEPLHDTVTEARQRGAAAREGDRDLPGALQAYEAARAAQAELNRQYPGSRYADLAAVDALDDTIASIRGTGLMSGVTARTREGDAAAAAGHADEAARAYEQAAAQQQELNAKYPKGRFVSAARIDELAVKRETVLSAAAVAQAAARDREAAALRWARRNAAAAKLVAQAAALLDAAMARYPRSTAFDPELRRRLDYLQLQADTLDAVQQQVRGGLAPLPGGGAPMLRTEVTQELYREVMNANPSRNPGGHFPVDSVNLAEAQEFCRRLSWLLGATVRLPTEAEFRAALAGAGPAGWSAENAGNLSHEPGGWPASADGFYDLRGNLAEWLQPASADGDNAPVGGGSFTDAAKELQGTPVASIDRHEARREVGFRVVVENAPQETGSRAR